MDILYGLLMGLVEGITEFLPVSSTGHLILAGHFSGFETQVGKPVANCFEVFIQLGAILAVVAAFPGRFAALANPRALPGFAGRRGVALLAVTTLPALIAGAPLHGAIKEHLFSPQTVAVGLMAGAIWIVAVERYARPGVTGGLDAITVSQALGIGLMQCVSLWPGVSRAGATILGAMMLGIDRKTATEYSFFAAVPVLAAAAVYDLVKSRQHLGAEHLPLFAVGFVASFVFAYLAVRWLMAFVGGHSLRPFAWYRIALALAVLWAFRAAGNL